MPLTQLPAGAPALKDFPPPTLMRTEVAIFTGAAIGSHTLPEAGKDKLPELKQPDDILNRLLAAFP